MDIAKELIAFFEEKGIKQEQLAEQLGVSQPYINGLLNGKKPFGKKQAQKFGELFGLSPSWLLTGEGEMLKITPHNDGGGDQLVGFKNKNNHNSDEIITKFMNEISAQRVMIENLIKQNAEKDKTIAELSKIVVELTTSAKK